MGWKGAIGSEEYSPNNKVISSQVTPRLAVEFVKTAGRAEFVVDAWYIVARELCAVILVGAPSRHKIVYLVLAR